MGDLVFTNNKQVVTSSLNVARDFDKRHDHVIRDIEKIIMSLPKNGEAQKMFYETYYTHEQNKQTYRKFLMNRDGFTLLAMGFNGKKAMGFKLKYIKAFNEMEKKLQPQSIEDLIIMQAQSMKEIREKVEQQDKQLETVNHRLDNIDKVDTIGDLQQRLNAMVRRFAQQEGIAFSLAWKEFRQAFNTAYRTNLTARINNYKEKHGLKTLTMPQYLSLTENLKDAIRVADKMLNRADAS